MKTIRKMADLDELRETCALDVTACGGLTQERVGQLLGVTTGRVCQIEKAAIATSREDSEERDAAERHAAEPTALPVPAAKRAQPVSTSSKSS